MTIMMIVGLTKADLKKAWGEGARVLKLIPGNSSINSKGMVSLWDLHKYYDVLEYVAELGFIFSIHVELAYDEKGSKIPEMKREKTGISFLKSLIKVSENWKHKLTIVAEHISTMKLLNVVKYAPNYVFGTITTQHFLVSLLSIYFVIWKNFRIFRIYYCNK